MDPIEQAVRTEHPDWTDEQVTAEVTRRKQAAPPPANDPPKPDDSAFARLRREKEAAEAEAQRLRDEAADRERKEAEEQGRWKELAEQQTARADRLEAEKAAATARQNAERAARDLKFSDPGYALYLLEQANVDLSDADAVKTRLGNIATDRPDLLSTTTPPPSGGPLGGGEPPAALDIERVKAMSTRELMALSPEDRKKVDELLAKQ